jgi:hypothetical protein
MPGDHFYTTDPSGELAPEAGYEFEGAACFVLGTQSYGSQPLFRWFNPSFHDHFYTINPRGEAISEYSFEGVQCYVFPEPGPNTVPLLRWLNTSNGHHFFTIDPNRELGPSAGYMFEGIACHVFPTQQPNTTPLFRWFQNGLMSNFTFDEAIPRAPRLRLLQLHAFVHFRVRQRSAALNFQERVDILKAYLKPINHGPLDEPTANSSAVVGGNQISINFTNLLPLHDREISQTLLHEMTHIAGYQHPPRQLTDVPGDNGPYYNSAPLRAELCIAGTQSDAGILTLERLSPELFPTEVVRRGCPVTSNTQQSMSPT